MQNHPKSLIEPIIFEMRFIGRVTLKPLQTRQRIFLEKCEFSYWFHAYIKFV